MTQIDIAALVADREAGTKARLIIEATWKPCVHGGGWWVARDADGFERLLAPDAFADDMEAALIAQDGELKRLRAVVARMQGIANELSWSPKTREISDRIRAALGETP